MTFAISKATIAETLLESVEWMNNKNDKIGQKENKVGGVEWGIHKYIY